jgi:metal-sulfur cluster biosynthetic enzyme
VSTGPSGKEDGVATEEQVWSALREVLDPELGVNVVDLGLVYDVGVQDGSVRVAMTMTTRACPLGAYLTETAEASIRRHLPEVNAVAVELVWEPEWDPAMMSAAAKQQLGWNG